LTDGEIKKLRRALARNETRRRRHKKLLTNPELKGPVGRPRRRPKPNTVNEKRPRGRPIVRRDDAAALRRLRSQSLRSAPGAGRGRPRDPDSIHEAANKARRIARVKSRSTVMLSNFASSLNAVVSSASGQEAFSPAIASLREQVTMAQAGR
jgi:hypothetical protein